MDHSKLDAALTKALTSKERDPGQRLSVFMRLDPTSSADERSRLKALGIDVAEGVTVVSADLSEQQVRDLSEQSCVKVIRLARDARAYKPFDE